MRILHTGDWHLGHTLRDHDRSGEHAGFLRWLVTTVVERQVDALLIAGDVFDGANPPPPVQRAWFRFLAEVLQARPGLQVVVIAGNHDSGARLQAPAELLRGLGVHVIGALPRHADGSVRAEDLLVPLRDRDGREAALCVAIPFLRTADVAGLALPPAPSTADYVLPRPGTDVATDDVIAGMRVLHERLFAAARARLQPGQALLALAHGYLVGGMLSELSERKVLSGNQHALPVDLFPTDCAYVALGHLHRPQPVAGHEHIRYAGSPLPLAMPERVHAHHVVFADLADGRLQKTWSLRTPRLVQLLRLPEHGELTPDEALAAVDAMPAAVDEPAESLPFLELAVRLDRPRPGLVEQLRARLQGKAARLVRVEVVTTGRGEGLQRGQLPALDRVTPEQVFAQRYRKDHAGEVPAELSAAFGELLDQVGDEGDR